MDDLISEFPEDFAVCLLNWLVVGGAVEQPLDALPPRTRTVTTTRISLTQPTCSITSSFGLG